MQAVITADIIHSTALDEAALQKLQKRIRGIYCEDQIEFFRGDSFQVLVQDADKALGNVILTRMGAIAMSIGENRIDIRQSIQLGHVKRKVHRLGTYMDETFLLSGRNFDLFQEGKVKGNLLISCGREDLDLTYQLMADYLDTLLELITPIQAEVMALYLRGISQKDIAQQLNKTGPTVNKQIKMSRADEILKLIDRYQIFTQQLQKHGH